MAKMVPRDPHQHHRVATPLELFFDLCFVVAVAQAALQLHHGLGAGHTGSSVVGFLMVFFAIWWAWMNFTWFASAYDTDDVGYRLLVFVQVVGVLVIAAGVPRAFAGDFDVVTVGYVIMRLGLVCLWLRAAADPTCRRTCLRYATGIVVAQLAWIGLLFVPDQVRLWLWFVVVPAEMMVPVWAERAGPTSWHPHHIAERYGLLTLIVLGESVLSATMAIQEAVDAGHGSATLYAVVAGAPAIVFSLWWIYFDRPPHKLERTSKESLVWGYGHYLIFASTAAVGAGLAVAIDHAVGPGGGGHAVSTWVAGGAVAVPVALYVMTVWFLIVRPNEPRLACSVAFPVVALLVLATTVTGYAVPLTGALLAALVAFTLVLGRPDPLPAGHHGH